MANGNGNGTVWKAIATVGVIGTMALQLIFFGQWKGVMETKIDNMAEDITELKGEIKAATQDRYTGTQAIEDWKQYSMDWDEHLRTYHGERTR